MFRPGKWKLAKSIASCLGTRQFWDVSCMRGMVGKIIVTIDFLYSFCSHFALPKVYIWICISEMCMCTLLPACK